MQVRGPRSPTMRRVLYLISVAFVVVPYSVYTAEYPTRAGVDHPVVLVVSDTATPSYGRLALGRDWRSEVARTAGSAFEVHLVPVPEGIADAVGTETVAEQAVRIRATVRRVLLPEIARNDVIAIVGNCTSLIAPFVLEVASGFRLPTLLTVATNDALLASPSSMALRLIPSDSIQVEAILSEIRERKSRRIAVFYERGRYGRGLYARLSEALRGSRLYPFVLDDENAAFTAVANASRLRPDLVVVLAYRRQTQLVALALDVLPPEDRPPILFADGAFGAGAILGTLPAGRVIFPVGRNTAGELTDRVGYHVFFHDAIELLAHVVPEAQRERVALRQAFRDTSLLRAAIVSRDSTILGTYRFSRNGENIGAKFGLLPVAVLDTLVRFGR